jgi:hypothetical protein
MGQSVSGDDRHEPYPEEDAGFYGPHSRSCRAARSWWQYREEKRVSKRSVAARGLTGLIASTGTLFLWSVR